MALSALRILVVVKMYHTSTRAEAAEKNMKQFVSCVKQYRLVLSRLRLNPKLIIIIIN